MSDLFKEKAQDWDATERIRQLSSAIGGCLLEQVNLNDNMTVMDFGAGTGLITSHVTPRVKSVLAVDISQAMLEALAAKAELADKVEILCQDITQTPIDKKFDLIISAMALHHVKDTQHLIQTFASLLNPGGQIALADLDKEDGSFHPADVEGVFHHGFDREVFQKLLEQNGFSHVSFVTAHVVEKTPNSYPVFLVTATKS